MTNHLLIRSDGGGSINDGDGSGEGWRSSAVPKNGEIRTETWVFVNQLFTDRGWT